MLYNIGYEMSIWQYEQIMILMLTNPYIVYSEQKDYSLSLDNLC